MILIPVQQMEIQLLPSQVAHYERVNTMLSNMPFALDLSMLGAGKTYTSTKLAMDRNYKHIIIICPVSVIPKWKAMETQYKVKFHTVMGYQQLRSVKFHQPKHGLLTRRDYVERLFPFTGFRQHVTRDLDKVDFQVTPEYKAMVEEGTFLIIDEIQNMKNISSQFHAASALIKEITLHHGDLLTSCKRAFQHSFRTAQMPDPPAFKSNVLLLSGSPMDRKEHSTHIFRALGIMTEDRLAQMNIQTRSLEMRGAQEIKDFCALLHWERTEAIQSRRHYELFDNYVYRLFQQVFKPHCSSSMVAPSNGCTLVKRNAFYSIDTEGAEIIGRGLNTLQTSTNFDGTNVNMLGNPAGAMASISRAMQVIETGKIQLFARVAKQHLDAYPASKVVIAVNFCDTITDLVELLQIYNPLVLSGSTSVHARAQLLTNFQQDTGTYRLLICNQSVASTGIDLDDKTGNYPRLCLVSPNYSTITSYQLGHRFMRLDTRSDAHVHFVFAKRENKTKAECSDIIELRVLDALSKKSEIMKETTETQVGAGVVFPSDHEEWAEDGTTDELPKPQANKIGIVQKLTSLIQRTPDGPLRLRYVMMLSRIEK